MPEVAAETVEIRLVSTRARPWGRAMPKFVRLGAWVKPFQPAPGRGAGRCLIERERARGGKVFQPAPGRGAGRCRSCGGVQRHRYGFNPRPAVGPGDAATQVAVMMDFWFQPAPGRGAGRCAKASLGCTAEEVFQPAPGRGAGRCYSVARGERAVRDVSTRARPWGRAMPVNAGAGNFQWLVSTRARPWGRAMQYLNAVIPVLEAVSTRARPWGRAMPQAIAKSGLFGMFQPAPGRGAGRCIENICKLFSRVIRFNPRPAVGPGDARPTWLSQPEIDEFQPAPGRGAGRGARRGRVHDPVAGFQPAPGRGAGRCPKWG